MGGSQHFVSCAALCALFVALAGCQSTRERLDLADNDKLYATPRYRAKVAADRKAFVPPTVDERQGVAVEEAAGPYPTQWMADGYWERTPAEMVGDCLRTAFIDCGVFAGMEETTPPAAETLIVEPQLLVMRGGQEERVHGRRSVGMASLRIVVRGPAVDGERPILLDEVFEQSVSSGIATEPERVPVVVGRAVQLAIARIVAKLDQSNVARSGI